MAHRLQSLTRVTSVLLLGRVVGVAFGLINSVVLARVLGTEGLGQYAYAMGLAAMFGLLPNLGLSSIITRAIALEPQTSLGALRTAMRAQLLLAVLVFATVVGFAAVLPEQPVSLTYVTLAAAQLALGSLSWPYLAVLGGRARYDRLAVAELLTGLSGTIFLLSTALAEGTVAAFLWAQVIAAGLSILVARVVAQPFLPKTATESVSIGALIRQAIPFGAVAVFQGFYTRADIMLLGQMASSTIVGLYSAAYKPINMIANFGAAASGTLFPYMVQETRTEPSGSFERVLRVFAVSAPVLALALTGCSELVMSLLFGQDFVAAAPILMVLAWAAAANWLYATFNVVLQARGWERWWAGGLAGALVMNVLLNLWTIPRWGGLGAAASTLTSETMLLGLGAFMVSRSLGLVPSLRVSLAFVGAVLFGGCTLYGLWPVGALTATTAALIVYGATLWLLRVASVEDVMKFLGRFRETALGHARI